MTDWPTRLLTPQPDPTGDGATDHALSRTIDERVAALLGWR